MQWIQSRSFVPNKLLNISVEGCNIAGRFYIIFSVNDIVSHDMCQREYIKFNNKKTELHTT